MKVVMMITVMVMMMMTKMVMMMMMRVLYSTEFSWSILGCFYILFPDRDLFQNQKRSRLPEEYKICDTLEGKGHYSSI